MNDVIWRRGHVEMRQERRISERMEAAGDLLVLTSSWERRCIEVARVMHGRYAVATVITFAEEGTSGRRADHDAELWRLATEHAVSVADLGRQSVSDVESWRDAIAELVARTRIELGRPLDMVVDVSCLPKYYMLTLMGYCVSSGSVRSLRLLYAEGRYAPSDGNTSLSPDHAFTEGAWRSLPVPYLEGRLSPDKKVEVIASIGFETFQARKLIRVYEAERHCLVTPYPGFSPEYGDQSEKEAKALATNLDLDEREILRCPAGDAAAAAEIVIDVLDRCDRFKEVGLCLGTKPHAIGFGIAALIRPDFTLVCRMPDRYVETETPATGIMWSYKLHDLSVATSPTHGDADAMGPNAAREGDGSPVPSAAT
ncbi:MAG: hypothetical protein K2W81_02390 [Sphingomonas sp.]|uniref:hypothetical protein n=1 Tax=Sphingomonas sp. TaxID=28214 RepID=UPI0025E33F0D|nr:hypothetical protein [Sphingomonas sp.]MBY0282797.1 hypothetical protein [Sphingomonas sp.]